MNALYTDEDRNECENKDTEDTLRTTPTACMMKVKTPHTQHHSKAPHVG